MSPKGKDIIAVLCLKDLKSIKRKSKNPLTKNHNKNNNNHQYEGKHPYISCRLTLQIVFLYDCKNIRTSEIRLIKAP